MKKRILFFCLGFSVFLFFPAFSFGEEVIRENDSPKKVKLGKVERALGAGYFRKNGFKDFIEPRVSFIKRKDRYSEVIEYSWRPLQVYDMPHKERIDQIRFSLNRYYFSGKNKKIFLGGGLGGNIILFNDKLKDWGRDHKMTLKDGVNGLFRVFVGYKYREVNFAGKKYPVVFRIDGFVSPPYKFGGQLGRAGEELKLTEFTAGISFSVE